MKHCFVGFFFFIKNVLDNLINHTMASKHMIQLYILFGMAFENLFKAIFVMKVKIRSEICYKRII